MRAEQLASTPTAMKGATWRVERAFCWKRRCDMCRAAAVGGRQSRELQQTRGREAKVGQIGCYCFSRMPWFFCSVIIKSGRNVGISRRQPSAGGQQPAFPARQRREPWQARRHLTACCWAEQEGAPGRRSGGLAALRLQAATAARLEAATTTAAMTRVHGHDPQARRPRCRPGRPHRRAPTDDQLTKPYSYPGCWPLKAEQAMDDPA